jgi:phospholipid/cholesterol/gamma-HCH transport system permease protein
MEDTNQATFDLQPGEGGQARLILRGRLDRNATASIWRRSIPELRRLRPSSLVIEARDVEYCDGAGIALLVEYKRIQQQNDGRIDIEGLRPPCQELMALFETDQVLSPPPEPGPVVGAVRSVGVLIVRLARDFGDQVNFTGEVFTKLVATAVHPRSLRWKDTLVIAEKAGANAVGIAGLLGFLIGLIIAFQSAASLAAFGAQVFVADLVVLGLLRELGPLITAFVLASRSGSAFAAEIGTMKVNEEIDALTTMALDPVQYLVLPRLIAAVCVLPLLTMFNELFGLIGCGMVMASWHVPPETYIERIRVAASLDDLFGGLVKTLVFGVLIAGLGCLRGLQTGTGPSAVGDSATRAVVSGIVAIIVADGVFAVVYYYLGI